MFSGAIPIPVSFIVKLINNFESVMSLEPTVKLTSPRWVNLKALLTKLIKICLRRWLSPITILSTTSLVSKNTSRPLRWPCKAKELIISLHTVTTSNVWLSISSLPASILEKSRISLIRFINELALLFASFK